MQAIRTYGRMSRSGIAIAAFSALSGCDADEQAMEQNIAMQPATSDDRPDSPASSGTTNGGKPAMIAQAMEAKSDPDGGARARRAGRGTSPTSPDSAASAADDTNQTADGGVEDTSPSTPASEEPDMMTQTGATGASGVSSSGAYTFVQCPDAMPRTDNWSELPACDGEVRCEEPAHCIPLDRLKMRLSDAVLDRTPDCTGGKCMPDEITAAGKFRFSACSNEFGEGRCVPQCFAIWVMPLSATFETGAYGCGAEEVCVPCLSPLNGEPTSACGDMCGTDTEM